MAGAEGALFGIGGFLSAIRAARPFLESAALVDLREDANRIAERAKELAPVGTPEEGDPHPGAMKEDISVRGEGIDSKGPYIDVGTVEPYGLFMEFGTEHNTAQPFMRPAIAEVTGSAMSSRINLAGRKRKA